MIMIVPVFQQLHVDPFFDEVAQGKTFVSCARKTHAYFFRFGGGGVLCAAARDSLSVSLDSRSSLVHESELLSLG